MGSIGRDDDDVDLARPEPCLGRRPVVDDVDDAHAAHPELAVRLDVGRQRGRCVDDDDRLQVAA